MRTQLFNALTVVILFLMPNVTFGQAPPALGGVASFALFTKAGALNTDGATVVTGDIASYTVFPIGFTGPGTVYGTIYNIGSDSDPAFDDVSTLYSDLSGRIGGTVKYTPLETQTFTPGVYTLGGVTALNGTLTLDGGNDPNSIFIIQMGGALTVGASSNVVLINKAQLCNVYWQINGAFSLGTGSVFRGTIVANGAITLGEGSSLFGRGLSIAGAINLHNNVVSFMPAAAGTITGTATVCQGQTGVSYTVPAIANASNYIWTLPAGATITAGSTTNTITVSYSAVASSGSITVTGSNSCGNRAVSADFVVTVNPATGATSFTDGATTVCQDDINETYTATAANSTSIAYSVLPVAAGVINATTGEMNWDAAFSGEATVTATSTGLCGTTNATRVVTVNPLPLTSAVYHQ